MKRNELTVVLVPGAMHGGWAWQRVTRILAAREVSFFVVTLTGIGDRSRLLHRGIDLEHHAKDVVDAIVGNGYENVVLVGHSQGGLVVSRAASIVPERIRALVYLDAVITPNGEAAADIIPPETIRGLWENAEKTGAGWLATPNEQFLDHWGVTDAGDRSWMLGLLSPHPIAVFKQKVDLSALRNSKIPITYVRCLASKVAEVGFLAIARKLNHRIVDIQANHAAPVTAPMAVADCIVDVMNELVQ